MLLCKYFVPELGYETEEKIQDNEYYSFIQRKPNETPASCCIKVIASGKWLERIREHFSNLPFMETGVYSPTIAWYGDHAKFVAGNISDVCSAYFQMWEAKDAKRTAEYEEHFSSEDKIISTKETSQVVAIRALILNSTMVDGMKIIKIHEVLDGVL